MHERKRLLFEPIFDGSRSLLPFLSAFHTEKNTGLRASDLTLVVGFIIINSQWIVTIVIASSYCIIIIVLVVHSRFIIVVEIFKRTETKIGAKCFQVLVETGLVIVAHKKEARFNSIEDCFQVALLHAQLKVIDGELKMAIYVKAKGRANRADQRSTLVHPKIMLR